MFLFGNVADLVEIAFEDGGVGDIFCCLGELEKDDSGTDGEETENDGDDLLGCSLETLKKYGGSNNRGASKVDVVGGRDKGSIEEIERFLCLG